MPRRTLSEARSEGIRLGAADAVVRLAAAHFWPHARVEDLALAAGVGHFDLVAAVQRHMHRPTVTDLRRPASPPPEGARRAPEGQKWCPGLDGDGHFVALADMGRNRSAPDGYSRLCRGHWRTYFRRRRQLRRLRRAS